MGNDKYAFCALLSRMKYIQRWGLMRNTRTESLSEHVIDVQLVAHILCLLAKQDGLQIDEGKVILVSLYHDVSEIVTDDMPSPIKYKREAFRDLYKQMERESALNFLDFLPDELVGEVKDYLTGDILTDIERKIIKSADLISGMIKCIEEKQAGNQEFNVALDRLHKGIVDLDFSPALVFVEKFLPYYYMALDDLIGR